MKNIKLILLIVITLLVGQSCMKNQLSENEISKETVPQQNPDMEDTPDVSDPQDELVFVLCDCGDSGSTACKISCEDFDIRYSTMATIIRDRPCDFPSGCMKFLPMPFDAFKMAIKSKFPEQTEVTIYTKDKKLVASADEKLGGALTSDKEGLVHVSFGLVDKELLNRSLILHIKSAMVDANNKTKVVEAEFEMGDKFFE